MKYIPTNYADTDNLVFKLNSEAQRLALIINNLPPIIQTFHVEPPDTQEGYQVIADGSDWNPGSGSGLYFYSGGQWHLIKSTAPSFSVLINDGSHATTADNLIITTV